MKNYFFLLGCIFFTCSSSTDHVDIEDSMEIFSSDKEVEILVHDLQELLKDENFTVFNIISHSDNAQNVNMELPESTLIIFGKPDIGTRIMQCDRRMGIELPLKLLVFKANNGVTKVAFWKMGQYIGYYELEECKELLQKINENLSTLVKRAMDM